MGRGRKIQRGGGRHFTNLDDLVKQCAELEEEKQWRQQQVHDDDDQSNNSRLQGVVGKVKAKGTAAAIEIKNPNWVKRRDKKMSDLTMEADAKPVLSRREKEEIEKQQARARYQKLHAEGKTQEAHSDLARLAIIRKEREAAAKKLEAEKLLKERAKQDAKQALAAKLEGGYKAGPGGRGKKKKAAAAKA